MTSQVNITDNSCAATLKQALDLLVIRNNYLKSETSDTNGCQREQRRRIWFQRVRENRTFLGQGNGSRRTRRKRCLLLSKRRYLRWGMEEREKVRVWSVHLCGWNKVWSSKCVRVDAALFIPVIKTEALFPKKTSKTRTICLACAKPSGFSISRISVMNGRGSRVAEKRMLVGEAIYELNILNVIRATVCISCF